MVKGNISALEIWKMILMWKRVWKRYWISGEIILSEKNSLLGFRKIETGKQIMFYKGILSKECLKELFMKEMLKKAIYIEEFCKNHNYAEE